MQIYFKIFLSVTIISFGLTCSVMAQNDTGDQIKDAFLSPEQKKITEVFEDGVQNSQPNSNTADLLKVGASSFGWYVNFRADFGTMFMYKPIIDQYTGVDTNDQKKNKIDSFWRSYYVGLVFSTDWSIIKSLGIGLEGFGEIYQTKDQSIDINGQKLSYKAKNFALSTDLYFFEDYGKSTFKPYISLGGGKINGDIVDINKNDESLTKFDGIYFFTGIGFLAASKNFGVNVNSRIIQGNNIKAEKDLFSQSSSEKEKLNLDFSCLVVNLGIVIKF